MNTQENNKLIAKFMGITPNEAGVYHVSKHKGYSLENLLYHTSWDWLMPVVNKCMQTGDNTDEWDALYDALSTVNKTNIHEGVVEFIKQIKK